MTLPLTHDQIFKFLEAKQKRPIFQKETGQNFIILKIHEQDIHVFFVILSEGNLLQLIGYFPFSYLENMKGDLSRFLHLLNKEIDMPGFGMDEIERVIFYRLVIPSLQNKFSPELIESYLNALERAIENFYGAISTIASGHAKIDEWIEHAKNSLNKGNEDV